MKAQVEAFVEQINERYRTERGLDQEAYLVAPNGRYCLEAIYFHLADQERYFQTTKPING